MTTTPLPGLIGKTLEAIVGASVGSTSVIVATTGDDIPNWRTVDHGPAVTDVTGKHAHLLGTPLTDCTATVEADASGVTTTITFRTVKGEFSIHWAGDSKATLAEAR